MVAEQGSEMGDLALIMDNRTMGKSVDGIYRLG
jgi:hypothetical protein